MLTSLTLARHPQHAVHTRTLERPSVLQAQTVYDAPDSAAQSDADATGTHATGGERGQGSHEVSVFLRSGDQVRDLDRIATRPGSQQDHNRSDPVLVAALNVRHYRNQGRLIAETFASRDTSWSA